MEDGVKTSLTFHSRREPIRQGADVIIIVQVFGIRIAGDPPVATLRPKLRGLRSSDQPEIMFGVLQKVLGGDRIVADMGVARQLEVLFRHLLWGASCFAAWPI